MMVGRKAQAGQQIDLFWVIVLIKEEGRFFYLGLSHQFDKIHSVVFFSGSYSLAEKSL